MRHTLLGLLAIVCVPGWAASYNFPSSLPAGCTTVSTGVYTCAALTLGTSDTVTVTGTANVTVTGNLAIKSSQVNAAGAAANMTLNVTGTFSATAGATLKANLTAGSVSSTGAVNYGGTVATTTTGAVSIDNGSTVVGTLSTVTGAITLLAGTSTTYTTVASISSGGTVTLNSYNRVTGDVTGYLVSGGSNNTIGGNVLSTTTYVSFADYANVTGNITGQTYVFTGHHATVGGNLVANGNQVDTVNYSTVGGSITAKGTYVNLGGHTTVGGPIVAKTYVDTGSNSTVNGDITSQTSYIDTGLTTTVYGSLTAGGTYVDIHSNANVTGSITAQSYVNMLNDGVVGGSITALTSTVFINDRNTVGGNVLAASSILIDDNTVISGNVTSSGSSVYLSSNTTVAGNVTASTTVHVGSGTAVAQCVRSNGPSTITIHSTGTVAGACCGAGTTCGKACISASTIPPDCSTLHHLEVTTASASGLTCTPTTFTIKACKDAASPCTAYTLGVTGNLVLTGTGGSTTAFTIGAGSSSTTVSKQITSVGSVVASITSPSPTPSNSPATFCGMGTTATSGGSCSFSTADSGLLFDVPNHRSEVAQTITVSAVKKSDNSNACTPAFANVSKSITFKCAHVNPNGGNYAVRVGATAGSVSALNSGNLASSPCDSTGRAVSLAFDASGNTSAAVIYADVGQMTLTAAYAGSGADAGLSMTGSDSFIVAPYDFSVSDLHVAWASATAAKPAGGTFEATITARNYAGSAVPNYGFETSPEGATLGFVRALPTGSGASNGVFTVGSTIYNMPGYNWWVGVHRKNASWSEVGTGDVSAVMSSGSYLGSGMTAAGSSASGVPIFCANEWGTCSLPAGATATVYFGAQGKVAVLSGLTGSVACQTTVFGDPNVGVGKSCSYVVTSGAAPGATGAATFIPHHFDTVISSQACSAGGFTYSGQPFTIQLLARNASGGTTANYDGTANTSPNFAKRVDLYAINNASTGSLSGTIVDPSNFNGGSATITSTPAFTFTNKLTAPKSVSIRATDTDGISSSGGSEGSVILRSGRLRINNAFGSEKSTMVIPVQAQYWTGKAWVLNSLDSCTQVPVSAVALGNYLDAKGNATAGWSTSVTANGSGKAISTSGGNASLTLAKPTSGSSLAAVGSVDIGINLGSTLADASCLSTPRPATTGATLSWLRSQFGSTNSCLGVVDYQRDPSARATFGVYAPELSRVIHAVEVQ